MEKVWVNIWQLSSVQHYLWRLDSAEYLGILKQGIFFYSSKLEGIQGRF